MNSYRSTSLVYNSKVQAANSVELFACSEYEIEVTTTDKKEGGMAHNAWLILEGDQKKSKVFFMENSAQNKILRR